MGVPIRKRLRRAAPALYVLATTWLWSLIPLAVKVAYRSFNFGFITFSRLALGTLVFAALELAARRRMGRPVPAERHALAGPRRISVGVWVAIAGVGIAGDLLLYTLGLRYTTASAATLIVSADGIILALLGVLVLRERLSWLKGAAGAAALAGLALVGWNGRDLSALLRSEYLLGNLFVLSAACCWAVYGLGQRVLASTPGARLFSIFLVGSALAGLVLLAQPLAHSPIQWGAVLSLAYLGLGATGLAYVLLVKGMERLEAATVGLIASTLPLFTMVEAHFLMGEQITSYLLGGAALIIAGVSLVMRHQQVYGEV